MSRTFVGFGFGAIQSGLFLYEAFQSGSFDRLVVAEVVPEVVAAVRGNGGYALNVATSNGIERHVVNGVEIFNPGVPEDAEKLIEALADAQEIGTALPSVDFFVRETPSVADLLRQAFLDESGAALIQKYCGLDPLFTAQGFEAYVDDLLERMMNPYLRDQVARVIRDPERKLGLNDRLIGTIQLIRSQRLTAPRFVAAAEAALRCLKREAPGSQVGEEVVRYLRKIPICPATV